MNNEHGFVRIAKLVGIGLLLGLVLILVGGTLFIGFLLWLAGDAPPAPLP